MLLKEDAFAIASAKKEAYIKGEVLNLIPESYKKIREAANLMEFETTQWINDVKFRDEIAIGLCKVLEESGYTLKRNSGSRNSIVIHIYWRDLSDKDNQDDV